MSVSVLTILMSLPLAQLYKKPEDFANLTPVWRQDVWRQGDKYDDDVVFGLMMMMMMMIFYLQHLGLKSWSASQLVS